VNDFPAEPLYTLIVDGVDRDDLEDWPSAWTNPPTPRHPLDRLAASITAARLRAWSEHLCRLVAAGPAETATALGIGGSVVDGRDFATVEPPPPGATKLSLARGDGEVEYLDLQLADGGPTRADLDARFGQGRELPRVDAGRPHRVGYHVAVAGAPFTCAVVASFAEPPTEASVATAMLLRRDRA
jgi:hypothetical protein